MRGTAFRPSDTQLMGLKAATSQQRKSKGQSEYSQKRLRL